MYGAGFVEAGLVGLNVYIWRKGLNKIKLPEQFCTMTIHFSNNKDQSWYSDFSGTIKGKFSQEEVYKTMKNECIRLKNDEGLYVGDEWVPVVIAYSVTKNKR